MAHSGLKREIPYRSGPRARKAVKQPNTAEIRVLKGATFRPKTHFLSTPPQTGQLTHWWPLTLNDGSSIISAKSVLGGVLSLRTKVASVGETGTERNLRLIRQSLVREAARTARMPELPAVLESV